MGAVTAIIYASKFPNNVRKMVLDSPFSNFKQLVKEIVNSRTGLPEFLYGSVLSKIEANIQKKTTHNLMEIDLKANIIRKGMENIPALFLISKDDKLVLPSHVDTLYEAHPGQKRLIYLEGSHNKPRPTEIRDQCAEFMCKDLLKSFSAKKVPKTSHVVKSTATRKFSEDCHFDGKTKFVSTSLIFNDMPSKTEHRNNMSTESSQMCGLNLNKQARLELQPSSATPTQREEQSLGKLGSQKISLSQLKKNQFRHMVG